MILKLIISHYAYDSEERPSTSSEQARKSGKDENTNTSSLPKSLPSPVPPLLTIQDPDGHRSDTASYEAWTSNVPRPVIWTSMNSPPHNSGKARRQDRSPKTLENNEDLLKDNQDSLGVTKENIESERSRYHRELHVRPLLFLYLYRYLTSILPIGC